MLDANPDAKQSDDPLDTDFVEFTTRLLSVASQDPSMTYSVVVREAQQVYTAGHHHDDGLPPYAFYEDANHNHRDSESEIDDEDVDPLQGFDAHDKPYRFRWTPHVLYQWLLFAVPPKYHAIYFIDGVIAKMQPYDFPLDTATQDTKQVPDDSESPLDEIAVAGLVDPITTACSLLHLPPELLHDIVLLAKDDDFFIPFTISYVNRFLRAIALDCALLWTTVDVMYGLERVAVQLERSREALLTVRASLAPLFSFDTSMTINNRFIALLSNHITRIFQLEATFVGPVLLEVFFSQILSVPEKLPSLRKLTFGLANRCSSTIAPSGSSFADVGSWERLTSLSLLGVCNDLEPCLPVGLVELCIEEAKAVDILTFLESLQALGPTLQKLSLAYSIFTSPTPEEISSVGAVELGHLRTLDINCLYGKDVGAFRDALVTPNLMTLMYATREVSPQEWTDAYLLHAARNCRHLRTLVLRDCALEYDTWKGLGDELHGLETLHLCWCTLRPNNMLAFRGTSNEQGSALPYPNLSKLILDNEIYLGSSDIVGLLKCRSSFRGEPTSGIDSLVMRGWDKTSIDGNDVRVIQELVGKLTLTVFDGEDVEASDSSLGDGGWDSTADWDSGDDAVIGKTIDMY